MNTLEDAPMYDAQVVSRLLEIPYDEEDLAKRPPPPPVPGYITFFDPGWNILILRDAVSDKGPIFQSHFWYETEPFADLEGPLCYRQLQMEVLHDSFGKIFTEQRALVPPDMEIPTARVVLMALSIHFLATSVCLFPNCWIRCIDRTADGGLVYAGRFDGDGVRVRYERPAGSLTGCIGIVLARKF